MQMDVYKQLAERLDALPNGFPATPDGLELRLLRKIFSPQEAALAAQLRLTLETPPQIAARVGEDPENLKTLLKSMAKRGLIKAGRMEEGLGYGLLPFVVGIYEMQIATIDAELAGLFEEYYQRVFGKALSVQPTFHRVIPVGESVRMDMEILPYESLNALLDRVQSWGVLDCICRKQKALIGDPCRHPLDVCLTMNEKPGAYDNSPVVRALTRQQAEETLQRAAKAGLVHTVSNNQHGVWYVCNCCTCSCGLLRGMVEMGISNVVASSAFVNQVDESLCTGCEICSSACQFNALTVDEFAHVDAMRCSGCGVCVLTCPEEALMLVRRPADQIKAPPLDENTWGMERAAYRGIDIEKVI